MRNKYALIVAIPCFCGTSPAQSQNAKTSPWSAEEIGIIKDFDVPECLAFNATRKIVFVSNISAKEGDYWKDDGKGFISLLDPKGTVTNLRWLDSTPEHLINAPKGMCVLKDWLYFTDNARLLRCRLGKDSQPLGIPEIVALPGAKQLNDLATDGKSVLVSDTGSGKVFKVELSGKLREIPSPENVNGVTFFHGKMFAVSWGLHDVYELDPAGKNPPRAFGLAAHFTNLDGIEVLKDGTFLVSDFKGNKVCTISSDRKTVSTLIELESPADIGIDLKHNVLYVPQFMKNRAAIFQLKKRRS